MHRSWLSALLAMPAIAACNFDNRGLVINEVMASNDNAWHDEWGEDEDYIEVINASDRTIRIGGYVLTDGSGERARLPDVQLAPGELYMMVADASPEQGPQHLPFKISSSGDTLVLGDAHGFAVERLDIPALGINTTLQRFPNGRGVLVACQHPSPARDNGAECTAAAPSNEPKPPRQD